ncbi:MAG: hypothetical protein JWQ43_3810 [Glaciihabitans sp.]|nr:hypothetical protein [Glaciihabitans sp.]
MNTPTLDPSFASAIENELASLGTATSRLQRHQRRARGIAVVIGTVALAGVLTGGAIVISNLPGETTTTPLGAVVTGTFTGTASIDLGAPPAHAGAVILDVTCTEGGTMLVLLTGNQGDAVTWNCGDSGRRDTVHISNGRPPAAGETSITITADPGTRWSVTAQYASRSTSEWKVNANGQTYGVANDNGLPDLSAAQATNGKQGYILNADLFALVGEGTINVYESDGETVIGQFFIGNT